MPLLLWLLGVPVSLVLILWLFGIVSFQSHWRARPKRLQAAEETQFGGNGGFSRSRGPVYFTPDKDLPRVELIRFG